jgi:hypothetical protein
MSKYNGSGILLYADGTEIAAQKSSSLELSQNLPDATDKQSLGWAEHILGLRSSGVPFENLQSTTGLSDKQLFDYINNRKSLMLVITGLPYPYVMDVDISNMTINAPVEEVVGLSGKFSANGEILHLKGSYAQLFTSLTNVDYDTFTKTGTLITSAINASSGASALSASFSVSLANKIKIFIFLTQTSGETPTLQIINSVGVGISNSVKLIDGFNLVTFVTTGADASSKLKISNTAAANFSTSNIYASKV